MEGIQAELQRIIEQEILNVIDFLITDLKRELIDQGHILTGKLRDSIEMLPLLANSDAIEAFVVMEDYYGILEHGVDSGRIPYGGKTGRGGKSKLIEALTNFWMLKKGLSEGEARSAAFATAHVMKFGKKDGFGGEGMPTQNSYKYAANNRRKEFLAYTIANVRYLDTMDKQLDAAFEEAAERMLDKMQVQLV